MIRPVAFLLLLAAPALARPPQDMLASAVAAQSAPAPAVTYPRPPVSWIVPPRPAVPVGYAPAMVTYYYPAPVVRYAPAPAFYGGSACGPNGCGTSVGRGFFGGFR